MRRARKAIAAVLLYGGMTIAVLALLGMCAVYVVSGLSDDSHFDYLGYVQAATGLAFAGLVLGVVGLWMEPL